MIALADVVTEFRTEELESITLVFDGALLLVGALFLFAALASRTLTRLCVLLVSTGMCCVLIIFVFALGLIPSALLGVVAIAATLGQVRETA